MCIERKAERQSSSALVWKKKSALGNAAELSEIVPCKDIKISPWVWYYSSLHLGISLHNIHFNQMVKY